MTKFCSPAQYACMLLSTPFSMYCVKDVRGELTLEIFQLGQLFMVIFGQGERDGTWLMVHDKLVPLGKGCGRA